MEFNLVKSIAETNALYLVATFAAFYYLSLFILEFFYRMSDGVQNQSFYPLRRAGFNLTFKSTLNKKTCKVISLKEYRETGKIAYEKVV